MTFKITISQTAPTSEYTQQHCWGFTIQCESDSHDPSIFVMHTDATQDGIVGDVFEVVASLLQMTELPKDTPTPEVPYYRLHTVELKARSPEHRQEFINKILDDIRDLVDNINVDTTETTIYNI